MYRSLARKHILRTQAAPMEAHSRSAGRARRLGRVSCNAPSHRLALAAGRRATASQAPPCRHGRLRPPANLTAGNEGARRAQHLRERGVHLVDIPDALAAISAIDINLWHHGLAHPTHKDDDEWFLRFGWVLGRGPKQPE